VICPAGWFVALVHRDCCCSEAKQRVVGWVEQSETHPTAYAFSAATPSISISIFGSGSACTTQVVRAGYGAGPNAPAYSAFIALEVGDDIGELGLEAVGQRTVGVETGDAGDEQEIANAGGEGERRGFDAGWWGEVLDERHGGTFD
jgi:hypothetical protein